MYKGKEINKAIQWLYNLYDEDVRAEVEECVGEGLDFDEQILANSIRDNAIVIQEYRAHSDAESGFEYYGKELFNQRATRIISYLEETVEDERHCIDYCNELWLLEDMTFAIVHLTKLEVKAGKDAIVAVNEYRSFVGLLENADDVFFELEDLLSELEDMCVFAELVDKAPIYEL